MHTIVADRGSCIGAGQCALVAGAVFDQDDDGIVELLTAHPSQSELPAARRAAALCP
ncbi:MAG: ferredoxin, partial [Microbacterium sp.]